MGTGFEAEIPVIKVLTMMRSFLAMVLTVAGSAALAQGQGGAGAKYGSRDPFVCKSKNEPAKGAPSPSQIKRLPSMQR